MIAQIAGSQAGVVTRGELIGAGVTPAEIKRRLAKGLLLTEYRGVYRVGHRAPSPEATYLAAVKACGEEAGLSGRPAGWLLRLLKGAPPRPEVTSPRQRDIPGLATQCCRALDRRDLIMFRGIPVTTVPRTLIDLAALLKEDQLARVCHEASVVHRTTPADVERALGRKPNAPGAATLRRILRGDVHLTLSKLEREFLRLLREQGLPLPETNKPADGRYVDCRWPELRLTVELDSYRYHGSRHAWEQDHRRAREAYARGDDFRRYNWGDVFEEPAAMLAELHRLLVSPKLLPDRRRPEGRAAHARLR